MDTKLPESIADVVSKSVTLEKIDAEQQDLDIMIIDK